MGFDINGTRFLLYARAQGVSFAKTAMIGRQELHLDAQWLRKLLRDFGYTVSIDEAERLLNEKDGYAEPLFEMLGSTEIRSFDADGYEGATNIHDFNVPIGDTFKSRFTLVVDAGTLEHVFNFPVAIKNCMEMLEVGGHFVGVTPANNFFGHGFYQFSPEVFFRVFAAENGFKLTRAILCEVSPTARWFEVADPEAIGERVKLINARRTYLLVIAQKLKSVPVLTASPQQSDYIALWRSRDRVRESGLHEGRTRDLKALVPLPVKVVYHALRDYLERGRGGLASRYNPKFFRKM